MDSKQRAWRPETEKKMRADWDHRARENVFYYIASSKDDWDPRRKRMAGSMVCRVGRGFVSIRIHYGQVAKVAR